MAFRKRGRVEPLRQEHASVDDEGNLVVDEARAARKVAEALEDEGGTGVPDASDQDASEAGDDAA